MKKIISVGLLLLAVSGVAHAADSPPALAATCAACHGDQGQGNAALGTPRLAGQQADYLLHQLRSFKAGKRGYDAQDSYGAQMRAIVAGLDDAAFEQLASYYSGVKIDAEKSAGGADVARGEALFQGTCAACHGPRGEGFAQLKTPRLNILDGAYIDRQLTHYIEGVRGGDGHADQLGLWMRGVALQVGEKADRQAIIDYIATLPAD